MTMPIKRFIRQKRQSCASVSEDRKQKHKTESDCPSKTNVPKWSNPEYKNETSEETRLELERKKQELLARLEKGGD